MLLNHEEIAGAIVAGDPPRAVEAMARHFDESLRALVEAGVA
jgi:DNA-binding GntR family transcriptional regulator